MPFSRPPRISMRFTPGSFTKVDALYESVVILAMIAYFFVYLVRLLKIMDTPFRVQRQTGDEVSLFLLNEFAKAIGD